MRYLKFLLKGSLWTSFFCFLFISNSFASSQFPLKENADINEFKVLLHISDNQKNIEDKTFYISNNPTKISAELEQNIRKLNAAKPVREDYICKFPARALWIFNNVSNINKPDFDSCPDLKKYIASVPNDKVSIIYASENLLSPSSFMGHTFIKLSSQDDSISHAASFFTKVDSINIPKIMVESLIIGKESYFVVSPYNENLKFYKDIEGRNVYEYTLKLTQEQRDLIKLHLWELRNTYIDYYFHNQNCASITLNIAAIGDPNLMKHRRDWLSPLDLIQIIDQERLIESSTITPSLDWRLRTYGNIVTPNLKQQIYLELTQSELNLALFESQSEKQKEEKFILFEFTTALNQYLHDNKLIDDAVFASNATKLSHTKDQFESLNIDMSHFKNPMKRSKDSQLQFGSAFYNHTSPSLKLSWMPASHTLLDDNRNAFSESSLEIFKVGLSINSSDVSMDSLTLYGFESYLPYDQEFGGLSGKFAIRWLQETEFSTLTIPRGQLSGGLGFSFKLDNTIQPYITFDSAISADEHRTPWVSVSVKSGLFAYLINDVKLNSSIESGFNLYGFKQNQYTANITLSYLGQKDRAFDLGLQRAIRPNKTESTINLSYRIYY